MSENLLSVAQLICDAERILFITGAGISADSGLPTYRGIGGLYHNQNTDEDIPIEAALSSSMFSSNPEIAWKYLWQIALACSQATYNQAHEVIAAIEQYKPQTWVLTQNVDGLHRAAQTQNLIEIHGRISTLLCTQCSYQTTLDKFMTQKPHQIGHLPKCPLCGGLIRPDVVLFGESLPTAAISELESVLEKGLDLVCLIGTSALFPYIFEPVAHARAIGIPTIEINPGETILSPIVNYRIPLGAASAFNQLERLLEYYLL